MVEEVEQHWDCLIIGAGISGLDAAYHLKVCKIRMREMKEYSRFHYRELTPHCEHFVGNKKLEPLVVTSKQTILLCFQRESQLVVKSHVNEYVLVL